MAEENWQRQLKIIQTRFEKAAENREDLHSVIFFGKRYEEQDLPSHFKRAFGVHVKSASRELVEGYRAAFKNEEELTGNASREKIYSGSDELLAVKRPAYTWHSFVWAKGGKEFMQNVPGFNENATQACRLLTHNDSFRRTPIGNLLADIFTDCRRPCINLFGKIPASAEDSEPKRYKQGAVVRTGSMNMDPDEHTWLLLLHRLAWGNFSKGLEATESCYDENTFTSLFTKTLDGTKHISNWITRKSMPFEELPRFSVLGTKERPMDINLASSLAIDILLNSLAEAAGSKIRETNPPTRESVPEEYNQRNDSEGVHAVSNIFKGRKADVVFIHGLKGGSHSTWMHGKQTDDDYFFWPEEMAKDFPDLGVWVVGYAAGVSELGDPGMLIEKRAGNIATQLTNRGIGELPIVFVTHSMGGLVIKSFVVASRLTGNTKHRVLSDNIVGIVFCGTPHQGSAFADYAKILTSFFGGRQRHVREMAKDEERLDFLHTKFLVWQREQAVKIESYAESLPLKKKKYWGRANPLGLVVTRNSANPGVGGIYDVDADHLSLVKPAPAKKRIFDVVYRGVRSFVAETTSSSTQSKMREDIGRSTEPTEGHRASREPAISKHLKFIIIIVIPMLVLAGIIKHQARDRMPKPAHKAELLLLNTQERLLEIRASEGKGIDLAGDPNAVIAETMRQSTEQQREIEKIFSRLAPYIGPENQLKAKEVLEKCNLTEAEISAENLKTASGVSKKKDDEKAALLLKILGERLVFRDTLIEIVDSELAGSSPETNDRPDSAPDGRPTLFPRVEPKFSPVPGPELDSEEIVPTGKTPALPIGTPSERLPSDFSRPE